MALDSAEQTKDINLRSPLNALWHAKPLPEKYLLPTAVTSGWVLTLITLAAYLFAAPRNWGDYNGLIVFHSAIVLALALISSHHLPIGAYRRLAALSFMLVVIGTSAHLRNGDLLAALFSTFPFAVFLVVAFGVRVMFSMTVLVHLFFFMQGLFLGQQDTATLVVYLSISFLWGLMVAIFITVLLTRIEDDLVHINSLHGQQSRLMNVISHELRVPAMTLSILTKRETFSGSDLVNMRDAADQLIIVIDNLRSSAETNDLLPAREDRVRLENFVQQLGSQFKPIIGDLGLQLYTDVKDSDDHVMLVDRFRLRSIIGNLLRTVAHFSDGTKIWLNANVSDSDSRRGDVARCVIEIEDNGTGISEHTARELLSNVTNSGPETSSTGQGLWVALGWLKAMAGEIDYYPSPRGGAGFRITLNLPFDLAEISRPDARGLLGPWDGMRVLVVERDDMTRLMIVRELDRVGMLIDEANSTTAATELLTKNRYDLQVCDTSQPDQSAETWLRYVQKLDERLPIVVLSGVVSHEVKAGFIAAGADVILEKPLHPSDLGAALQSLVALGAFKSGAT